jgi:hypothetical protein
LYQLANKCISSVSFVISQSRQVPFHFRALLQIKLPFRYPYPISCIGTLSSVLGNKCYFNANLLPLTLGVI